MNSWLTQSTGVALALLALAACSREAEETPVPSQDSGKAEAVRPASSSGDFAKPAKTTAPEPVAYQDSATEEPMDAIPEGGSAASGDLMENPAFKKMFEDTLKGYQFNDDQKKRLGDLVHLLKAVDPQNFDNKERHARLGLTGKVADLVIDTSATGDVEGLIDNLLTEIEEIAFDPIDTPDGVASDGGVLLHFEEKKQ